YSVNNTMLIYMQKPDATLVAGYNKWKDQFERHVKKGEHGITIIAPTPYKKKIEEQKLDPDTKAPILDKDGKIVTEEKEIEIPMFRPVKVFDVSQTDGKPLPELASSLSGTVENYDVFMEALRRSSPVPITIEAMPDDTDGYFYIDNPRISVRFGMSEVQTVSASVHEIAHSKLHNRKKIQIANDEQYQEIELFEKPGLFSNGRIVRDNLPEGVYCYDLRGSDDDPGEPVSVEEKVQVNHAGSVLLTEPLELPETGYLMLTEEEGLNF
ncbi:LPD28 domain-containing protein, partial [Hungatella hathewayi]